MKIALSILSAVFSSLYSISSFASDQIQCFEKNASVPILSYTSTGFPSQRLSSAIIFDNQVFGQGDVAQYKNTLRELYFVVDDQATSSFPLLTFESESEHKHSRIGRRIYEGRISIFTNSVRTGVKRVKCRVTSI